MRREFFLETDRIGFSKWQPSDTGLAALLWGDPEVTRYICASGKFDGDDIRNRLETELRNETLYGVQYWPVFDPETEELIGCCGLRPRETEEPDGCSRLRPRETEEPDGRPGIRPLKTAEYEIGFHLRPKFWGRGYAKEAAEAVIGYAFSVLGAEKLFAGHNPNNTASKKVLASLGFSYTGDEFYAPTSLFHPSYELKNPSKKD